ncbi:MAG TPA: hypothetical protein VF240_08540 [Pyrinomonadaceae bacterium]
MALALSGKSVQVAERGGEKVEVKTRQDWQEKHIEGVKGIVSGAILLAVSLLIGVALALFVPGDAPWILIWMVFFGWLAVWGGIEMASGVGGVIEAKGRLRMMKQAGTEPAIDASPQQLSSSGEPVTIEHSSSASRSTPPLSVTEGTTRHLDEFVEK